MKFNVLEENQIKSLNLRLNFPPFFAMLALSSFWQNSHAQMHAHKRRGERKKVTIIKEYNVYYIHVNVLSKVFFLLASLSLVKNYVSIRRFFSIPTNPLPRLYDASLSLSFCLIQPVRTL
jgi:hypothetical protein